MFLQKTFQRAAEQRFVRTYNELLDDKRLGAHTKQAALSTKASSIYHEVKKKLSREELQKLRDGLAEELKKTQQSNQLTGMLSVVIPILSAFIPPIASLVNTPTSYVVIALAIIVVPEISLLRDYFIGREEIKIQREGIAALDKQISG